MYTFLSKFISYAKKDKADNQRKNKWESQVIQELANKNQIRTMEGL